MDFRRRDIVKAAIAGGHPIVIALDVGFFVKGVADKLIDNHFEREWAKFMSDKDMPLLEWIAVKDRAHRELNAELKTIEAITTKNLRVDEIDRSLRKVEDALKRGARDQVGQPLLSVFWDGHQGLNACNDRLARAHASYEVACVLRDAFAWMAAAPDDNRRLLVPGYKGYVDRSSRTKLLPFFSRAFEAQAAKFLDFRNESVWWMWILEGVIDDDRLGAIFKSLRG